MKTKFKFLALIFIIGVCNVFAQEKYSFSTWSNQFDARNDDAYYLVISDPVKNWYSKDDQEKEDWITDFRVSANDQADFKLMQNFEEPVPDGGSYEKYTSLSRCKEAIQDKVSKFKKDYSGYNKPVRVIYVNLNSY